jgi:hypothetical protein
MTERQAPIRSPVFIVGSARSGTSILVDGLLAAGYAGCREGHFLTLLQGFDRAIKRHVMLHGQPNEKVLAGRVDWTKFKADVFDIFKCYTEALNPVAPWIDKTGGAEMIETIPLLRQLWPDSHFIFAKRRAIENVVSRLTKFPNRDFEKHCADWTRNMAAWRGVRDSLGHHALEIDQQDILRNPERVAAQLGTFLGLGPASEERASRTFAKNRPQQTQDGSAGRVSDLNAIDWSTSQKDIFLRLCGQEMALFNYSLDSSYWTDMDRAQPGHLFSAL